MNFYPPFEKALERTDDFLHIVTIGTKPDIIKQIPLYRELLSRGFNVVLGHTGQHYDHNLSQSMLDEFGVEIGFNIGIEGSVTEKIAGIGAGTSEVISRAEEAGKTPIFYVHGDTMTASATATASYARRYPVVHVEAGIRSLTLKPEVLKRLIDTSFDWDWYKNTSLSEDSYVKGSVEPYPEQYNTRIVAPAAGLHFAPDKLAVENLRLKGFPVDRIHLVGNTVADITREMLTQTDQSTIFEQYPFLNDGFIRFCIHRHENCSHKGRFTAIFEAMEQLAQKGLPILLIMMHKTRAAIEEFGLQDRLEELKKLDNVLITDIWPLYSDVIAAMQKALVCVTDSGSMQEEMHLMNIPCVTLRYGTDRPETLLVGTNIIAPPHEPNTIARIIESVLEDRESFMRDAPTLYGENVSSAIADVMEQFLSENSTLYRDEHDLLKRDISE